MIEYRCFRNTDPPRLVEVWNQAFTGRGTVGLRTATPLERFVFAKTYFDPAGLILAMEGNTCLGFVHAGLVDRPANAPGGPGKSGVICMLGVLTKERHKGIGAELLRRAEDYLRGKGADQLYGGSAHGCNPFYFGLYGGAWCSGFLLSDVGAEAFFLKHGYSVAATHVVLHRPLDIPIRIADSRFALLRNQYHIRLLTPRHLSCAQQECTVGVVEPVEFRMEDKTSGAVKAHTLMWEMEGFSNRWGFPAVGLLDYVVEPAAQRQGMGKYMLAAVLKQLQDQYFQVVEVHIDETNEPAKHFLSQLGFEQVDVSRAYVKNAQG